MKVRECVSLCRRCCAILLLSYVKLQNSRTKKKTHFISKFFSSTSIEAEPCFFWRHHFLNRHILVSRHKAVRRNTKTSSQFKPTEGKTSLSFLNIPSVKVRGNFMMLLNNSESSDVIFFSFFYRHRKVLVGRRCGTTHVL